MSALLEEIRHVSSEAADQLEGAGFHTDSDIQSLTRQDLHELLPGVEKLKLRKEIFEIVHKRRPIGVLLEELIKFIPHESVSAALTDNGVWVQYLQNMKDMKTLLGVHIDLLENIGKSPVDQGSLSGKSHPVEPHSKQTDRQPQRPQVMYQMVVRGETFGSHRQLMHQVQTGVHKRMQLIENSQDTQIAIVFCPIRSRVLSDVDAVMTHVRGDKPFILVLMHHAFEPKITGCGYFDKNAVLVVNVFFHETKCRLLKCLENQSAVRKIQEELLKHCSHRSKDTSEWYMVEG
ncbi:uncharacterized protein LOC118289881 [Scophthalmus maximus]|uniref:uncharacterized protein LOC118289881 n=1 Tax=Scophthalmus maximus TaxID=52904 RepID=UPI001FA8B40E|nr:uncharacterized protein LOC118289881 [Scophthalmus maximus]